MHRLPGPSEEPPAPPSRRRRPPRVRRQPLRPACATPSSPARCHVPPGRPLVQPLGPRTARRWARCKPLALYGPLGRRRASTGALLGCVFEHGDALHLLFNMSVVYTLGITLERGIGSLRFLALSLVTALGASAFALFFNFNVPDGRRLRDDPRLGGGAMLPIATQQGRKDLDVWLVQVAVISLLPGVSWAGHLGGFLFGLPCGLALR